MVLRPEDFPVLLENANGSRPLFKMQLSILFLAAAGFIVICASFCSCDPIRPVHERNENMSRPTRPKIFSTPEELKSYLEELGNFYAIAGRPRFGKRTAMPWASNYFREDPTGYRNFPITKTDLLQMLSSMSENQE
ncbi:hypothetical protein RUM44_006644 [Polyplax serrata]|uniref:Neuropeptide Y n=1 Tax=Polyplax serrata TaxID=468196 RepID=A0ABR1AIQ8_POLSC